MSPRIYLDHNATTPVDPSVEAAVVEGMRLWGNPSSPHEEGRRARQYVEKYRQEVADFLQVHADEIFFTSGGTEGAAFFLRGLLEDSPHAHLVTTSVEHLCVTQTAMFLQKKGALVSYVPVGEWGAPDPKEVEAAILPETRLLCFTAVNSETGVKSDVEALAAMAKRSGVPLVLDGVCWLGKEKITIPEGVSGIFFSGHKIAAPKGIGFCFCRRGWKGKTLLLGGEQESRKRAGTENIPGIFGLAQALRLLQGGKLEVWAEHMQRLRERFEQGLVDRFGAQIVINGLGPRVCNTTNCSFLGIDGESLLIALDLAGISVSFGSACSSGGMERSRVLQNMGLSSARTRSALRFSFGRDNRWEEVERVVACLDSFLRKSPSGSAP